MENTNETFRIVLAGAFVVGEYLLVLVAVLADLWSGLRKARKRGEARRSEALRRTVSKLGQYYNVMLSLTVVDAMQMGLAWYVSVACDWHVPLLPLLTVLGAIGIAAIEVKSIYEKAEQKTRRDYVNAAQLMFKALRTLSDKGVIDLNSLLTQIKDKTHETLHNE
ncbi:MAG: hypothetical protein ACI308_07665 [Muribaculaceae bacterium]